jgi:hypothetical protein
MARVGYRETNTRAQPYRLHLFVLWQFVHYYDSFIDFESLLP